MESTRFFARMAVASVLFVWTLLAMAQSPVDGTYGGPGRGGVYLRTGNGPIDLLAEATLVVSEGALSATDPFAGDALVLLGAIADAGGGAYTARAFQLVYPLDALGIPSATVFHIQDGFIRATNRAGAEVVWLEVSKAGARPPTITQEPQDLVLSGEITQTLNVVATGAPPLSYQWYRNGQPSPDLTVSLLIRSARPDHVGSYFCVVSNDSGSVTSRVAQVRVDSPPPKATLPATFELTLGLPQGFGVTVSGGREPYAYAWEKDGVLVAGVTGPSMSFATVSPGDAGSYRCVVTDAFGNQGIAGPTVVTVQLPPAPRFESRQLPLTQPAGSQLLLLLHFSSQQTTPPTATWRRNGVPVSGTTVFFDHGTGDWVAVFQLAVTQPGDSGRYDCVAQGLGGTTISEASEVRIKAGDAADTVDAGFDAGTANRVAFGNPSGDGAIEALAIQADDRIVVAGVFQQWNGQARTNLVRLNVDGTLDTGFAAHHFTPGVNGDIAVPGLAVAPDGKIYLAGTWRALDGVDDGAPFHLVRLHGDGRLDQSFALPALTSAADELVVLADGTLFNNGLRLVNGTPQYLLKFPGGGAADPGFGAGYTAARFAGNTAGAMVADAEGGLIVGGAFGVTVGGVPSFNLARLRADGSVDAGFRSPLCSQETVNRLARQADGKIVAVGDFGTTGGNVRRFLGDGSADPGFASVVKDAGFSPLALTREGAVLVAPETGNRLARLRSNGAEDEEFLVRANDDIQLLAVDTKGRIVIAGYFTEVRGSFDDAAHAVSRRHIARLKGGPGTGTEVAGPVNLGGVALTPGGQLGIQVPTQAGFTYVLEKKGGLGEGEWTVVQTVVGDGSVKSLEAAIVGASGFFRIRVQP